jgi:hypothetical protein
MRSSWAGVTTELLPRSPRISGFVGRRPSGVCRRFGFGAVTLTAFLLTAAFLVHEWDTAQTNGAYIASMTIMRLRPAPDEGSAKLQWRSHWKHQLQQVPDLVTQKVSRVYGSQQSCPNNCSNIGNCLSDLGECQCPGGEVLQLLQCTCSCWPLPKPYSDALCTI